MRLLCYNTQTKFKFMILRPNSNNALNIVKIKFVSRFYNLSTICLSYIYTYIEILSNKERK